MAKNSKLDYRVEYTILQSYTDGSLKVVGPVLVAKFGTQDDAVAFAGQKALSAPALSFKVTRQVGRTDYLVRTFPATQNTKPIERI
jgi:hypothetical protein